MSRCKKSNFIQWTFEATNNKFFISAIAKINKKINEPGFNDHLGLSNDERNEFNDFVEQIGLEHFKE